MFATFIHLNPCLIFAGKARKGLRSSRIQFGKRVGSGESGVAYYSAKIITTIKVSCCRLRDNVIKG